MKQLIFLTFTMILAAFVCSACTEEGLVKVFECDEAHPYFSKITHMCYPTEADREAADANDPRNPNYVEPEDDEDNEDDEDDKDKKDKDDEDNEDNEPAG